MGGGLPGLHWSGAEVEWHGCGVLLVKNSQGHVKGVAGGGWGESAGLLAWHQAGDVQTGWPGTEGEWVG